MRDFFRKALWEIRFLACFVASAHAMRGPIIDPNEVGHTTSRSCHCGISVEIRHPKPVQDAARSAEFFMRNGVKGSDFA